MTSDNKNSIEFKVVGCPECEHLQIVKGQQKTTKCRRCKKTHQFSKLRKFYSTGSKEEAEHARALKLAERSGMEHQFRDLLKTGKLSDEEVETIADEEFLSRNGIDPKLAKNNNETPSKPEVVYEAIEELEEPTTLAIVTYAEIEYGFEKERIRQTIERLRQSGDIMKNSDNTLRTL